MQTTTSTIPAALHKCKHCGAITTLPDILCIKAPEPAAIKPTDEELMKEVCGLPTANDDFDFEKQMFGANSLPSARILANGLLAVKAVKYIKLKNKKYEIHR